jgi:hypothetical protein
VSLESGHEQFEAGRLKYFVSEWEKLTQDNFILEFGKAYVSRQAGSRIFALYLQFSFVHLLCLVIQDFYTGVFVKMSS